MVYRVLPKDNSYSDVQQLKTLKSGVRYKLLTYEEALEKAKYCGRSFVKYGYDSALYNCSKGDKPYIMLKLDNRYGNYYTLSHMTNGINISTDMVELYTNKLKYNKELL